jgi:hypothetical protein
MRNQRTREASLARHKKRRSKRGYAHMARPKVKPVYLARFFRAHPDLEEGTFTEFDEDEWVRVVAFGSLPNEFATAIFEAYRKEATDDQEKVAIAAEKAELTIQRRQLSIVDWNLKDESGRPYPSPKEDPTVWDRMSHNLKMAIDSVVYYAFDGREDKLRDAGEELGSSPPSTDEEPTPISSGSNSAQSASASSTNGNSPTRSGSKPSTGRTPNSDAEDLSKTELSTANA